MSLPTKRYSKEEWARNMELPDQPVGFTLEGAKLWAMVRALKQTHGILRDAALLLGISTHFVRTTLARHNLLRE